jgi:hypothetical protein
MFYFHLHSQDPVPAHGRYRVGQGSRPGYLSFAPVFLRPVFTSYRWSVPLVPILHFPLGLPPADFSATTDWISVCDPIFILLFA